MRKKLFVRETLALQGSTSRFVKTLLINGKFVPFPEVSYRTSSVTTPKDSEITPSDEGKGRILRMQKEV